MNEYVISYIDKLIPDHVKRMIIETTNAEQAIKEWEHNLDDVDRYAIVSVTIMSDN